MLISLPFAGVITPGQPQTITSTNHHHVVVVIYAKKRSAALMANRYHAADRVPRQTRRHAATFQPPSAAQTRVTFICLCRGAAASLAPPPAMIRHRYDRLSDDHACAGAQR